MVTAALPRSPFRPLRRLDGYLPIEDYGLIGDGATAALVGRDGAIGWLCVPRFDSAPLFADILDSRLGGSFTVAPEGLRESRQYYVDDTGVLVTEMRSDSGLVQVTDALTLASGADLADDRAAARGELVRMVRVLEGRVQLNISLEPCGGCETEVRGESIVVRGNNHRESELQFWSQRPLPGRVGTIALEAGETQAMVLRWGGGRFRYRLSPEQRLEATIQAWQAWAANIHYEGPQAALVRRSAITLKLLEHFESGAIIAAPTSSLPEAIGGVRNWDYRYAWVRDAAFSVYALQRTGMGREAAGFLEWAFNAFDRSEHPRVLYTIDGDSPAAERMDEMLEGYRQSRPVRWGNAAAAQLQHDIYGEIMDCAYQWAAHHGTIDGRMWARLRELADYAVRNWHTPDQGIWEVRTPSRPFTYSAALCHVALDRAASLAARYSLDGDIALWRSQAAQIQRAILEESWNPRLQSFTEHIDGDGGLDASLLALPIRRVIDPRHPRMVATVEAIRRELSAGNGLLYRYIHQDSPDGLPGHEGAFLICSFWVVDNLVHQGRLEEALELYDSLCSRASPLGLLPEQIDPETGTFRGNFPQAFSHVGVISSGFNLSRAMAGA